MGFFFLDLDEEMDRILGYSFHELVEEQGWLPFRELEYKICKGFSRLDRSVIALGGGTIRYEWNRDVLQGTGLMILLHAELETLAQRVRGADRPRVNPNASLEEDLRSIWESSKEKYLGVADLVYRTDLKAPEEAVAELKAWILKRLDPRSLTTPG